MKRLLALILISLLVWNSSAQVKGFEIVGPLNLVAANCLKAAIPISFLIVRIYKISGTPGVDQGGVQTFTKINRFNFPVSLYTYVEICRSADPATIAN